MKTNWIMAALLCTAATAAAQDRTASPADDVRQMVTMTGCVTRDDMSYASGRLSTDGRAVTSGGDADRFNLSDARVTTSGQARATGTSGTTTGSTDPVAVGGARYLLVGKSADLRPHLGHQVEVTGRIGAMDQNKGSGPAATANKNDAAVPQFTVDSIKMITATCTPAK